MAKAIIGHTGFVGGNLVRQAPFDDCYNSKNIEDIAGRAYDLIVCAGAPAEKWKANQEPLQDLRTIERLTGCLGQVKASRFILISTIDVYPNPVEVDEASPVPPDGLGAYGRHRRMLETFIQERFDSLVVRLPGLFGEGLKKNIVYDFLHNNNVDRIHAESVYQFYNLDHLWEDIQVALRGVIPLINFATEPVSVGQVAQEAFRIEFDNRPDVKPASYDFRTRHDGLFGGSRGYLYDRRQVLREMRTFVTSRTCQP